MLDFLLNRMDILLKDGTQWQTRKGGAPKLELSASSAKGPNNNAHPTHQRENIIISYLNSFLIIKVLSAILFTNPCKSNYSYKH